MYDVLLCLEMIRLGEYVVSYEYRFNRFVEICGGSDFKEWSLESTLSFSEGGSLMEESRAEGRG